MKKLYSSITIAIFGTSIFFGQIQEISIPNKVGTPSKAISVLSNKGFSPHSAFLLMELDKLKKKNKSIQINDSILIDKYNLFVHNNELFVNSFLIISDEFNNSKFESRGCFINSTSQNIISASIPVNILDELINFNGILFIQIAEKVRSNMDNARTSSKVDLVHQGNQLTQAYFGDGVVIGIIDGGFDYTHPNFYDGTGTNNYRVKRVWEQNTSLGTPPNGFAYGRELITQTAILNAQTDILDMSHGTHVAGIAAGAGGGGNNTYSGVAPKSELVFVSYDGTDIGVADGIAYIFNYANSINKPCVINLSLGKHLGPHDGMSALDQYYDGVIGPGKLLVGAAGNEGGDPLYVGKTYTSTDNILYSFISFSHGTYQTSGYTEIDIWGEPNQNYKVAVNIYNTNTSSFEDYTPYVYANSNTTYSFTLEDNDLLSDECNVEFTTSKHPLNDKFNVRVNIDHTEQDDDYKWAMIEIIATDGHTNMWANDINSSPGKAWFTNYGKGTPWVSGSTSSTVGEIGGTGNSIISVGAYTSKNYWTSFNSSPQTIPYAPGEIASFSSKGPTADNRTKPDITAPGNILASSVSSFDNNYTPSSTRTVSGVTNGTKSWYFGMMEGTSMASPMVTGILALWLEANPHLTPDKVKEFIKNNAQMDNFTGNISNNGNNTWGWGKINAYDGLVNILSIGEEISDRSIISVYPNPNLGEIFVNSSSIDVIDLKILDYSGRLVMNPETIYYGVNHINASILKNGLYFLSFEKNNLQFKYKLIICK